LESHAIKRAALAIREARSQDFCILAHWALEATVRSRNDLVELLNDLTPQRVLTTTLEAAPAAALALPS
jgi:hypothetical protein